MTGNKRTGIFISNRNTRHQLAILPTGNLQGQQLIQSLSPGHIPPQPSTRVVTRVQRNKNTAEETILQMTVPCLQSKRQTTVKQGRLWRQVCREIQGEGNLLTNVCGSEKSMKSKQKGRVLQAKRNGNGLVKLFKMDQKVKSNFHSINNVLVKLE